MASQNYGTQIRKRGRDEYWNGASGFVESKRTNYGVSSLLVADAHLMALLERIDNPEEDVSDTQDLETHQEERLSGVIKSLEEEIGLNQQPPAEQSCAGQKGGDSSLKQVEDEASSVPDVGELMRAPCSELQVQLLDRHYYEDVHAEFGFFVDAADELGIGFNHCACIDGNSITNIYSAIQPSFGDSLVYNDSAELFYGSLWDDDIWQSNDVNQTPQQEVGMVVSNDVCHDIRSVPCLNAGDALSNC